MRSLARDMITGLDVADSEMAGNSGTGVIVHSDRDPRPCLNDHPLIENRGQFLPQPFEFFTQLGHTTIIVLATEHHGNQ